MQVPAAVRWDLDPAAVLHLNGTEEIATSHLEPAALESLLAAAFWARGVDQGRAAFLIALDQAAAYASVNYQWFRQRLDRFVYIDRVVVAASSRGRGLARQLYADLAAAARTAGHTQLTCEVNREPPNPASDALHAALGFRELGQGTLVSGKVVRYLAWDLR